MRDITGYEGEYGITSCGRVYSYKSKKFLKKFPNANDRERVTLCKDGHKHNVLVHQLVANAFIPNPNNLPEVDHIDKNYHHNNLNNLRWADKLTNTCNRSNVIPVYDTTTGMIYCSINMAVRETKVKWGRIKKDCDTYHSEGILSRFIFVDDMNAEIVTTYYQHHPEALFCGANGEAV